MNTAPAKRRDRASGKNPLRRKLALSAFILLIVALGFNAMLTIGSLEKLYIESIVSKYHVIGKDLQRKIERSLGFGKPIAQFFGMNEVLEETRADMIGTSGEQPIEIQSGPQAASPFHITVSVALPDGSIPYSTNDNLIGSALPEEIDPRHGAGSEKEASATQPPYTKYNKSYYLTLPVHDREKNRAATLVMSFGEKQITDLLDRINRRNAVTIGIILLLGTLLIVTFLHFAVPPANETKVFPKLRISIGIFLIIGSAQILFSTLNTNRFKDYYLEITKEKVHTLASLVKEDVEYVFSKGVPVNKLVKMEMLLGEVKQASPELNDISILDREGTPLYTAVKDAMFDFQKMSVEQRRVASSLLPAPDPAYSLHLELLKDGREEGHVSANISKDFVFGRLKEIVLDSVTVLAMSLFFFVELIILVSTFMERRLTGAIAAGGKLHYGVIRPASFLFLFSIDISISITPLYMEEIYQYPLFDLSEDIIMGLPISAEMLFAGVAVLIAATWLDRRGWHEPFFCGIVLALAGVVYSWTAPDALHFILSRGIVGLGFGLFIMAAQGFLFVHTDERSKAQGLAQFFAGIYAGSICGAAAGAMLAERIGYNPVFLLGGVILCLVLIYSVVLMRDGIQRPGLQTERQAVEAPAGMRQVLRFLGNKDILGLILLVSLPASMAFVGFLYYFGPIYLNRIGASQSNIGRIYMIYGICLIYIAPFISRFIDASESKKSYVILSGILGGLAFVSFHFLGGMAATAITVLLLGLSGSFDASRAYALRLLVTRNLGEGKAMGIYSSVSRIGQVMGPLMFGWLIMALGMDRGIVYFGFAYLVATLLFLVLARNDRHAGPVERSPVQSHETA